MKLPAGSLIYALLLALLMGMVAGSMVLYHQLYLTEIQHWQTMDRLVLNSQSGMNWILASDAENQGSQEDLDLFGEGRDSVFLSRKHWGIFEMASAQAHFKGQHHQRIAMIGKIAGKAEPTLYLSDRNKPLALCGKTRIVGDALLPKAGAKRAYIEGQTFTGTQLINGKVGTSERSLPPLNSFLMDRLINDLHGIWQESDSVEAWDEAVNGHFSWIGPRTILEADEAIQLNSLNLSGQLVIYSNTEIYVSNSCALEDVILIAPIITVQSGFWGTAQLMATQKLQLEKKVQLSYPSVAALFTLEKPLETPLLWMEEDSILEGVVFSYRTFSSIKNKPRVQLDKNATVIGQLYCQGQIDLKGNVYGSLYGDAFYLATPSATYENHLLNATIDLSQRHTAFIGIDLPQVSEKKGIVKWLKG